MSASVHNGRSNTSAAEEKSEKSQHFHEKTILNEHPVDAGVIFYLHLFSSIVITSSPISLCTSHHTSSSSMVAVLKDTSSSSMVAVLKDTNSSMVAVLKDYLDFFKLASILLSTKFVLACVRSKRFAKISLFIC